LYKFQQLNPAYTFHPQEYNESILRQANNSEIAAKFETEQENARTSAMSSSPSSIVTTVNVEAKLTSIESGLAFIHFTLTSSDEKLKQLERQLASQREDDLVRVNDSQLKVGSFYLAKLKTKLYRCIALTPRKIKLVDYGSIVDLNQCKDEASLYVIMPKYFKYNTFAMHCRLATGNLVEKSWSAEEKVSFLIQLNLHGVYQIKLYNAYEPYIFEFCDQKINLTINGIVSRVGGVTQMESQTLVQGHRIPFQDETFYLGGNWMRTVPGETSSSHDFFGNEKLYLYSERTLDELAQFNKLFDGASKNLEHQLKVTSLRKNEVYLSRTRCRTFLDTISNERVREIVRKSWLRVRVKDISANPTTGKQQYEIIYCDLGIETSLSCKESIGASGATDLIYDTNFKFVSVPPKLLLWPTFVFECYLDKSKINAKLNKIALDELSFIDPDYINQKLDSMRPLLSKTPLQVALLNEKALNLYTEKAVVDLTERPSEGRENACSNLIDTIFALALTGVNDYLFECVIVHVNSVEDFYVQKVDAHTVNSMTVLQSTIQAKVQNNELKPLHHVDLNKLCVAFFTDDEQYYRAKVINQVDATTYTVFFIDFGNTSTVQIDQLREISLDLVDNLPKSLAINCKLKLNHEPRKVFRTKLQELNEYFFEVFAANNFYVKCVEREVEKKYNDSYVYVVEIFDTENKINLLDTFSSVDVEKKTDETPNQSCMELSHVLTHLSNGEDDRAQAYELDEKSVVKTVAERNSNAGSSELDTTENDGEKLTTTIQGNFK
jgi:hypothetical protein